MDAYIFFLPFYPGFANISADFLQCFPLHTHIHTYILMHHTTVPHRHSLLLVTDQLNDTSTLSREQQKNNFSITYPSEIHSAIISFLL